MAPRRNIPPFEIMGSSPPTPPTMSAGRGPRTTLRDRLQALVGGMSPQSLGQWWSQANGPVMVRIPRGYLVLLVASFLLLIVLAYWVGSARGYYRVIRDLEEGTGPSGMARTSELQRGIDGSILGNPSKGTSADPSEGGEHSGARGDPREPGKNYLILARYPLEDAQRLIAFLGERGVEAKGIPAHTRGLWLVVATRGFDRTEVNAEAGTEFKNQMRRIGRAWQAQNGPQSDDLASMYFSRYDPKEGSSN